MGALLLLHSLVQVLFGSDVRNKDETGQDLFPQPRSFLASLWKQHRPSAVQSCPGGYSHVSMTAHNNLSQQKVVQKKPKGVRHSSHPQSKLLRLRGLSCHPQVFPKDILLVKVEQQVLMNLLEFETRPPLCWGWDQE